MNAGILGSGWAEFGYLGVIEQAGIVFGVSCLWDLYFMKRFGLLARVLLSAYFVGFFFNIVNGDLMFMLTGGGLIVAPIFVFFLFRSGEALASLTLRKDKLPPVKTQLQEQQNGI
jgi:hypothetical protein